ncbi:MAG: type IX secretion system membrane protein PorP/SprF [Flavobacteriales bacterium]|nr:type IX secretion system membrane protein PorP/SprF [Flavobacteriales bacterium]
MYKVKHTIKAIVGLVFICFFVCTEAKAQYDLMLTQYMNNELIINPGYAGSRDHVSVVIAYRKQWAGIEGAPKTQTFSIHAPINDKRIALGFSMTNEQIGVTQLFSAFGTFAYRMPVNEEGILSLGLQGGIYSLQEDYSRLASDCCGNSFDPLFMQDSPTKIAPKVGFGAYYYDSNFYAGWSVPRLIESSLDPLDDFNVNNEMNLRSWHNYLIAGYLIDTGHDIKLKPSIMTKVVHGAPLAVDLTLNTLLNEHFWIGASYRTGDSFSFLTSVILSPQLRVGYSYDVTISELSDFDSGSHEVMIGYDLNFRKLDITSIRYF